MKLGRCIILICLYFFSSPQQGIFKLSLNSTHQYDGVAKNVYKNTKIYITVNCEDDGDVNIGWMLRETCVSSQSSCNTYIWYDIFIWYLCLFWFHFFQCWNEFAFFEEQHNIFENYYQRPNYQVPGFQGCHNDSTPAVYQAYFCAPLSNLLNKTSFHSFDKND